MSAETRSQRPNWSKIFVGSVIPALLLAPLPAYAMITYSWNTISNAGSGTGTGWGLLIGGSGESLQITPASGTGAGTVTITGTATWNGTGNSDVTKSGTPVFSEPPGAAIDTKVTLSGDETLGVTIGVPSLNNNILNAPNQFSSSTQPSAVTLNSLIQTVDLAPSTQAQTISVVFTLAGNGTSTSPGSSFFVTFQK